MTFAHGEVDTIDEFTISEHSSSVQVTVVRTVPRLPHIPTFGSVCHDIKMLIQECSSDKFDVKIAFSCEHCPDKDHFVIIPPVATAQSLLLCQHDHTTSLTIEQQYWMKVPNTPEVCCPFIRIVNLHALNDERCLIVIMAMAKCYPSPGQIATSLVSNLWLGWGF